MEHIVKDYFGHKNLVLRMLREHREQLGLHIPFPYEKIYSCIIQWYTYLYSDLKAKTKRKHPFQMDMECLGVFAVEAGLIRGREQNPLSVFQTWFMEHYLHFIEHLDTIHDEHSPAPALLKKKKATIVETKWDVDRSDLNNLYD